jgi:hypothetical protein
MFDAEFQMHFNDIFELRNPAGSIVNYVMMKEQAGMLNMIFDNGNDQLFRFSRHMNRLYLDGAFDEDISVGDYIVIEGYSTINPNEFGDVYNDMFLKRYLTALIKRQWGNNAKKFTGMQLPGGIEINGQAIYDEAVEEIQTIEEEMQLKYEFPPMMAIG